MYYEWRCCLFLIRNSFLYLQMSDYTLMIYVSVFKDSPPYAAFFFYLSNAHLLPVTVSIMPLVERRNSERLPGCKALDDVSIWIILLEYISQIPTYTKATCQHEICFSISVPTRTKKRPPLTIPVSCRLWPVAASEIFKSTPKSSTRSRFAWPRSTRKTLHLSSPCWIFLFSKRFDLT